MLYWVFMGVLVLLSVSAVVGSLVYIFTERPVFEETENKIHKGKVK